MKVTNMNYPLYSALEDSIEDAERFIIKAKKAKRVLVSNEYAWVGTKETGAVKRASMDLTRALVSVRNPTGNQ